MKDSNNLIEVETIKRIHVYKDGVFLEIGPDRDMGSAIEIRTTNEESRKWFGDIRFIMSKELAKKVARALNEIVDQDMENKLDFTE